MKKLLKTMFVALLTTLILVGSSSMCYAKKKPKKSKIERITKQEDVFQWIRDNLQYPKDAYECGITGRVRLRYDINKDGSVSNVKVINRVYPSLDAEALRVISNMPKHDTLVFKPGNYTFPVIFRLL